MSDEKKVSQPNPAANKPAGETQSHSRARSIAAIVAVLAIVAAFVIALVAWNSSNDDSSSSDTAITEAIKQALTVKDGDELTCGTVDENGLVSFTLETKTGVEPVGNRLWSDSLGLPVDGTDAVKGLQQTQAAIWHGPDIGVTYAHFLAKLDVNGTSLVTLNPWLAEFNTSDADINNQAASYILPKNPSDDDYKKFVQRNKDYQDVACKVNTLLSRFHVAGIESLPSVLNYRQAVGGLSIGEAGTFNLPNIESTTDVDNRPAIVLELTSKTAGPCDPVFAIGINVGDKRPELFNNAAPNTSPECSPSTTPPASPPVTPPGNPPTTTPPTNPPTTTPPTSPPTTPPTTTTPDCPPGKFRGDNGECLDSKVETTNPARPDGITPQPLPSTDPIQQDPPTLSNPQTTPAPADDAAPGLSAPGASSAPSTPRTSTPSVPSEVPDAGTNQTMPDDPGQA